MTTLVNPLLPGFNPDPSIVAVDGTYYLATSTFEYLPGIPIHRSTDFANWQLIGHVATRPGQLSDTVPTAGGAWAPTIRHRDGVFHLVITDALGRGALHFTATDAAGPWSDGTPLPELDGIDPDLAWSDDGTAIITYSALSFRDGGVHRGIEQVRVDLDAGALLEPPRPLWSGTGLQFPEAPHLYRRGDWWYLMIAEGGTERGHGISIARSRSPYGPFEGCPANPLVSARSTSRPIQNTGHGDLVVGPDGEWLCVLLGVRPRSMTRAFSALGRETFITTVEWGDDDWPRIAPVELAPRPGVVRLSDDFEEPELGGDWIAVRRLPAEIGSTTTRPGWLTVEARGASIEDAKPAFIGRRVLHPTARASIRIDVAEGRGGIVLRYDETSYLSVVADGASVVAHARLKGIEQSWSLDCSETELELAIDAHRPRGGGLFTTSDDIDLVAIVGGAEHVLATIDGRYLSSEVTESFTGRVVGVAALDGVVHVDRFEYVGSDD